MLQHRRSLMKVTFMNLNVYNMNKKLEEPMAEMLKHISCKLPQTGHSEHNIRNKSCKPYRSELNEMFKNTKQWP
jgi:hypothetical protein